jgi:hypothetical protein
MLSLIPVNQQVADDQVADVARAVQDGLANLPLSERIQPGMSVAVAVGSRGIACYTEVVKATVEALRQVGAEPFLVPAMGSHGGGTAEGQRQLLESYGMAGLGVPIRSSLETIRLGQTQEGLPVYWDTHAAQADAVIPINRVKAHTAFRGEYESGLFKILALGLGKPEGAARIHAAGIEWAMPAAARFLLARMPIPLGIAIVENGYHQPARIAVLAGEEIPVQEPLLLNLAKQLQPRIPFAALDLLIIQRMGKDISGTGMDTNVVGMWRRNGGPRQPNYRAIAVLELTPASHGNATGIGMADLIPQRLADQVDWPATYTNCLTSGNFNGAKQPITLPTDQAVITAALAGIDPEQARVVYIPSTLDLGQIWVSPPLLAEVEASALLTATGPSRPLTFSTDGKLVPLDSPAISSTLQS